MAIVRRLLKAADAASEAAGAVGKWFAVVLVLVGTFETISRHFFGAPTIWSYDMLSMAGGALYLLGASYDLKHNAHTRVDLLYSKLKPRTKALMDVLFSLLLFFPLTVVLFRYSIAYAVKAWRIHEVMFSSFWYPPAGPYRTLFAIGFALLLVQGLAELVRNLYFVVRGAPIDQP